LSDQFRATGADSRVASEISKARRALEKDTPDREGAFEAMQAAQSEFNGQKSWRQVAIGAAPELFAYEEAIRDTIGLRQLDDMPRSTALSVAACSSDHRDISLNF